VFDPTILMNPESPLEGPELLPPQPAKARTAAPAISRHTRGNMNHFLLSLIRKLLSPVHCFG